jgi:hypothetical protein
MSLFQQNSANEVRSSFRSLHSSIPSSTRMVGCWRSRTANTSSTSRLVAVFWKDVLRSREHSVRVERLWRCVCNNFHANARETSSGRKTSGRNGARWKKPVESGSSLILRSSASAARSLTTACARAVLPKPTFADAWSALEYRVHAIGCFRHTLYEKYSVMPVTLQAVCIIGMPSIECSALPLAIFWHPKNYSHKGELCWTTVSPALWLCEVPDTQDHIFSTLLKRFAIVCSSTAPLLLVLTSARRLRKFTYLVRCCSISAKSWT